MHGTSLASAKTVLAQAEPVLSDAGADAGTIGGQLLDAVSIFDGSGPLRRALTDPAREGKDKAALVKQLFAGADKRTVAILSDLVSQRWSSEEVLADAAELIGVEALLIAAENAEVLPLWLINYSRLTARSTAIVNCETPWVITTLKQSSDEQSSTLYLPNGSIHSLCS